MESKISNNRGTNSEELTIQSRKIPSERFHYLRSIINKDGQIADNVTIEWKLEG